MRRSRLRLPLKRTLSESMKTNKWENVPSVAHSYEMSTEEDRFIVRFLSTPFKVCGCRLSADIRYCRSVILWANCDLTINGRLMRFYDDFGFDAIVLFFLVSRI